MRRDKFAEREICPLFYPLKSSAAFFLSQRRTSRRSSRATRAGTMKFEEKLAASMRRSWEEHYIDYKVCSAR